MEKEYGQEQDNAGDREQQIEGDDLGPEEEEQQRDADRSENLQYVSPTGDVGEQGSEHENRSACEKDKHAPIDQVDMHAGRGIETAQKINFRACGRLIRFVEGHADTLGQFGFRMTVEQIPFGIPSPGSLAQNRTGREDQLHIAPPDHHIVHQAGKFEFMRAGRNLVPYRDDSRFGLGLVGEGKRKDSLFVKGKGLDRNAVDAGRDLPPIDLFRKSEREVPPISDKAEADPLVIGVFP